jgi:intracellular sulfur oxidation DsrE/DsrF family protein
MTRHHIAIRCFYDSSDPLKLPIGFSWIANLLTNENQPQYQITMWCVGNCLKYLMKDYEKIHGNPNPHQIFLNKLIELGGKIIVCNLECESKNITKDDLLPFVTVVPLAIDYMITYQEKNRRFVIYDHEYN